MLSCSIAQDVCSNSCYLGLINHFERNLESDMSVLLYVVEHFMMPTTRTILLLRAGFSDTLVAEIQRACSNKNQFPR